MELFNSMTISISLGIALCLFWFSCWRWSRELYHNKILGKTLDDANEELNSYRRTLHQLPKVRILLNIKGLPMAASVGDVAIVSREGMPERIIEYDCLNGKFKILKQGFPLGKLEIDETVKLL